MEKEEILEKWKEADMVLVGLGSEFDGGSFRQSGSYARGKALLQEEGCSWLLPLWKEHCSGTAEKERISAALQKLVQLLGDKNYFAVSVSSNSAIAKIPWKQGRIVMPCGSSLKKQCEKGCQGEIAELTQEDGAALQEVFSQLAGGGFPAAGISALGKCSHCGGNRILNTVYAEHYDESGYLEDWSRYTKWLQGTLNRRLFILELGVDLTFPSVIRWPFEKVAFFNEKAFFCRVNEKLYQMTEELASKGVGISQNTIDWINHL